VNPSTGLHPRPAGPEALASFFPADAIDTSYTSTVYPSRRGETLQEIHDRAKLFVESWTNRVEALHDGVKCVSLYSHAASVIAIGRAVSPAPLKCRQSLPQTQLTGNPKLDVKAGCASTSLYRRKVSTDGSGSAGIGEWDIVWNGQASYLANGLERNWSVSSLECGIEMTNTRNNSSVMWC
jgi:transcription factor C subunit 7